MIQNTILYTHMGAGDGINQSGMAVAMLDKIPGDLWFPCYPQYETTFKSFFQSYPRIKVFTVPHIPTDAWGSPTDATYGRVLSELGVTGEIVRCGVYRGQGCWEDFTKNFYHDAGVTYESSWQRCPISSAAWNWRDQGNKVIGWRTDKRRVFLHEDNRPPQRNFRIWKEITHLAECEVYRPQVAQEKESMLIYADLINTADEIHCIDSSFFWFVNSLNPRGRLFLHKYTRWPRDRKFRFETRYHWNYID
jgi:hypothetical protein